MFTILFWKQALERSVKTFAQSIIAATTISGTTTLADISMGGVFATAGVAAVISILTSIVSAPLSPQGNPSLIAVAAPPGPQAEEVAVKPIKATKKANPKN